jgi:hypothetical protein
MLNPIAAKKVHVACPFLPSPAQQRGTYPVT